LVAGPASVLLLPTAQAQIPDAIVCVHGNNADHPTECEGLPCEASVESFGEALALAMERAEILPSDAYLKVCSVQGAGEVHFDDVVVDSRAGLLGGRFELDFGGTILCPRSEAQGGPPHSTLTWMVEQNDILSNLVIDYSEEGPCPDAQRGGIEVSGGGLLQLDDVHFTATLGNAITIGPDGPATQVDWRSGSSSRGIGTLVETWGALRLGRVMVAGSRVGGDSMPIGWEGSALIESHGPQAGIELEDTIFWGNACDSSNGAPVSLVHGRLTAAHRVTFIENVSVGGGPLLKIGFIQPSDWDGKYEVLVGNNNVLKDLVFVRNRQLANSAVIPQGPLALPLPPLGLPSCAGDVVGASLEQQPSPWEGLEPGSGSLIEVVPYIGYTSDSELVLARSTFVDNELGGAPIITTYDMGRPTRVQILQCTFANNGTSGALQIDTTDQFGEPSEVLMLRNLLLGSTHGAVPSVDHSPWLYGGPGPERPPPDGTFLSMNVLGEGDSLYAFDSPPKQALLGPNLTYDEDPGLTTNSTFASLSPCERFQRVCPGADETTCAQWTAQGRAFACVGGTGGNYLLSADDQAALDGGRPWPWDTDFFTVPEFPGWTEFGAAGWTCLAVRGAIDAVYSGGELQWGDADGQPEAIDCDNEDPKILALWPEFDGYSSAECEAPEDSCFLCPAEPEPEPETPEPEPETPEPEPDQSPIESTFYEFEEGCSPSAGWGVSWSCGEGGASVALLVLLLPAVRRRQRR
jgi:hypothetical protein